jgi:uncharacterized protein YjiS (DUF1127 family)
MKPMEREMSRYKAPTLFGAAGFGRPSSGSRIGLLRRFVLYLLDCLETYRQRRALECLDDRMLKDIGLSRCDVEAETSRPFWR